MPTSSKTRPKSSAPDAGLVQLLILLGWVPTGITALVCGVVIGLGKGSLVGAVVAVVAGTLVGWIAILVLVFTVGWYLEQHGRLGRHGIFEATGLAFGVLVTVAIAYATWINIPVSG